MACTGERGRRRRRCRRHHSSIPKFGGVSTVPVLRTTGRIGYSIENNLTILSC